MSSTPAITGSPSSDTTLGPTSRDRVLSAAQQLIVDHGFVDFSMRELAELSGLAKATLYHHFPDKQTICLSVVELEFLALRDCIAAAAQSATEPVERLRAIVDELLGPPLERRLLALLAVHELAGMGLQFHDIIKKHRNDLVAPIAEVLRDGIEQGVFRAIDVDKTILSLLGMMQSYIAHRLLVAPNEQLGTYAEHTLDLLLNGISSRQ